MSKIEDDAAFVERVAPNLLIHVQAVRENEGTSDYDRPMAIARKSASRPAPADAVKVLVEALREVVGCFDAAQAEGLLEKVAGDEDLDEPGSLADLYNRRLSFAYPAAVAALSDPRVIAAQSADPWLPIASAPKDGTHILVHGMMPDGPRTKVAFFEQGFWVVIHGPYGAGCFEKPGFWIPLPTAPARQYEEPS